MADKWKKEAPGVRVRLHPTRKHGVKPDKYFVLRYTVNGKHKQESLGWASEGWTVTKALEALTRLKTNIRTGQGPTTLADQRLEAEAKRLAEAQRLARQAREEKAFGDFWRESYYPQAQQDKTPGSWKREDQFYRLWVGPVIGRLMLKAVSPLHLERIKKNMADAQQAPRSIAYCFAVVRQVFNHARRLGLYEGEAPTGKVKLPKVDNRRLRYFTREEAAKLLTALAELSPDVHDMALLSLYTGLRAKEVFTLAWVDVDLEHGLLTIRDPKNTHTRHAYMTEAVKGMLQGRPKDRPDELVFPARSDGPHKQISQSFPQTVNALGFNKDRTDRRQKATFHTLRHTYASWLVMGGTPLYTVQRLMGHRSIAMTERYAHLAPDHKREAVKGLEAQIASAADEEARFNQQEAE